MNQAEIEDLLRSRLEDFALGEDHAVFDAEDELPDKGGIVFWARAGPDRVRSRALTFTSTDSQGRFGAEVHLPTARRALLNPLCGRVADFFRAAKIEPGIDLEGDLLAPPQVDLRFIRRTVVLFYSTLIDHPAGA